MTPPGVTPVFDDAAAYQAFMGRWSRAAGEIFLEWLAPPRNLAWLDAGCGTGAFTELVLERCAPATIAAVDPLASQIDYLKTRPLAARADVRVADAQALPFDDGAFDIVASALVINFIPDKRRAIAEMRRVVRAGGIVAGYVWDFANDNSPTRALNAALRAIGQQPPRIIGADETTIEGLKSLFAQAELKDVKTLAADTSVTFKDFGTCWATQTPAFHPLGKLIAAMSPADRLALKEKLRVALPASADGSVTYQSRANFIQARAP